jgi:hypothetical protein
MSNQAITAAVQQLKQEHIRLCKELERVDEALSALASFSGIAAPAKLSKKAAVEAPKRKRRISAAARKKMSEAARARWAARKKEKAPAKDKASVK